MMNDLMLPHSIQAEQSVIGGLILDNDTWGKVSEILQPNDFYNYSHRIIYAALQNLALKNQPYDILTLREELNTSNRLLEAGGEVLIYEVIHNTPSSANIVSYANIVRNKSIMRKLLLSANQIQKMITENHDGAASEILGMAEKMIFELSRNLDKNGDPKKVSEILGIVIDGLDKLNNSVSRSGIETGYRELDNLTDGFQRGDLIILAARPSMGKTSLAMNIAEYVASCGKGVIFYSMEMSSISLIKRILSSEGKITQNKIKKGSLSDMDFERVGEAVKKIYDRNIFLDESSCLSPSEILSKSRRIAKDYDIGLIVVDYLQLMKSTGKHQNRNLEVAEISRGLKMVAKELNLPVLALSQLNRAVESRQEKTPTLADLRDSGGIEQDADLIIFIYRDEIYNKNSSQKGISEIMVAKHRNGELLNFPLMFAGKYTRFENPIEIKL